MNILIIAVVLIVVVFAPLIFIWALNTLFPILAIPYTFWTWLAMLCVCSIFGGSAKR